jgi:hypothetical protein
MDEEQARLRKKENALRNLEKAKAAKARKAERQLRTLSDYLTSNPTNNPLSSLSVPKQSPPIPTPTPSPIPAQTPYSFSTSTPIFTPTPNPFTTTLQPPLPLAQPTPPPGPLYSQDIRLSEINSGYTPHQIYQGNYPPKPSRTPKPKPTLRKYEPPVEEEDMEEDRESTKRDRVDRFLEIEHSDDNSGSENTSEEEELEPPPKKKRKHNVPRNPGVPSIPVNDPLPVSSLVQPKKDSESIFTNPGQYLAKIGVAGASALVYLLVRVIANWGLSAASSKIQSLATGKFQALAQPQPTQPISMPSSNPDPPDDYSLQDPMQIEKKNSDQIYSLR